MRTVFSISVAALEHLSKTSFIICRSREKNSHALLVFEIVPSTTISAHSKSFFGCAVCIVDFLSLSDFRGVRDRVELDVEGLEHLLVLHVVGRLLLHVGEEGPLAAGLHHDAAAVLVPVALDVAAQAQLLGLGKKKMIRQCFFFKKKKETSRIS